MLYASSNRRQIISCVAVLIYVVSIFHRPMMEGGHCLLHLSDLLNDDFEFHTIDQHQDHQHRGLATISLFFKYPKDGHPFNGVSQKMVSKLIQICPSTEIIDFIFDLNLPVKNTIKHYKSITYRNVLSPPPKI